MDHTLDLQLGGADEIANMSPSDLSVNRSLGPSDRGALFASRACPFGYDWLGRQFAVDSGRLEAAEPLVLLFEPGTGEVLEIPLSFSQFHDSLAELREPALAESFFSSWIQSNPELVPLGVSQCVGYKVPLYLGGKDRLDNLEVIDLEVYWSLSGQLHEGTRLSPPGTSVGEVGRA